MSKWMPHATAYTGVKEISGVKDNATIVAFFESVGHGWVKDDETPWCAAFVGACLEEVGIKGTDALHARSFLKWGKAVSTPRYGDIVVLWRGKKTGWEGHVGFFVKEEGNYVYLLGGNQRNAVNVSRYKKSRVLGYRRPSSMSSSRTVVGATGTAVGTGGAAIVDTIQKTQSTLAGVPLEIMQYVLAAVTIAGIALVLYARWDDLKRKGR